MIAAIYLAGLDRMERTAADLARVIDFKGDPVEIVKGSMPLWGEFPAAEAMEKIGAPSTGPLLELLGATDQPMRRDLALSVLREVDGDESVTEGRLERARDAEKDSSKKQRLESCLGRLRDPKFEGLW